jgi:hypothetical protein
VTSFLRRRTQDTLIENVRNYRTRHIVAAGEGIVTQAESETKTEVKTEETATDTSPGLALTYETEGELFRP